jgi:hypothetical protein
VVALVDHVGGVVDEGLAPVPGILGLFPIAAFRRRTPGFIVVLLLRVDKTSSSSI